MTTQSTNLESALGQFGLNSFRPGQREVIESIVAGNDCMCVMPTGGGKSLCYQLPAIIRPGLTIVVSPLIALMKDQVDGLARNGISAALINSTLSQSEQSQRLQQVAAGEYQLVYVAPERLRNSRFLEAIRATPIQLLAVDEAHCISQWGHDFRPDYARIGQFRQLLGGVQTVALTATATPRVRTDIVEVLQLKRPKQFMSGFARPNLHFGVVTCQSDREKEQELEEFLRKENGSGIIYSATRKRCEAMVDLISKRLKIPVGAYHAGLMPDQRRAIQERFMKNQLRVIVATNAFGMGIDKPDLRFVIHYNMPGSLEAYYQEAGRAGRDGKLSQCVMLYSFQDRHIQEFFIDNSYPARELIKQVYDFLLTQNADPIELTLEEIRDALGVSVSPEAIGSCLQILGRTRVLNRLEMGSGLAVVRIDSRLPTLVDLLPRDAKVRRSVLRLVERAVGDRRGEDVYVHPRWLLQESGMNRDALNRALRELAKLEEFDYIPPFRGRAVHFRQRDIDFNDLEIDFENLRKRKEAEVDRLNQVVRYAQTPLCRQAAVLQYFGDQSADDCGRCDRCGRSPGWPVLPTGQNASKTPAQTGATHQSLDGDELKPAVIEFLNEVVEAISRVHGRLGKHLLSQYLCGSKNAKVQKLNLHRLSGFGMLVGFRQADGVELLDALIAVGVLQQKEVNRNRPTLSITPELMDLSKRPRVLGGVHLGAKLLRKVEGIAGQQASKPPATARSAAPSPPVEPPVESPSDRPVDRPRARSGDNTDTRAQDSDKPKLPVRTDLDNPSKSSSPSERSGAGTRSTEQAPTSPKPHLDSDSHRMGEDWRWSVMLFQLNRTWPEVLEIRRMTDDELSASLCNALLAGETIKTSWLSPVDDADIRTRGQQRVLREMRRRTAAGVSP